MPNKMFYLNFFVFQLPLILLFALLAAAMGQWRGGGGGRWRGGGGGGRWGGGGGRWGGGGGGGRWRGGGGGWRG